jgi:hypothetical protein
MQLYQLYIVTADGYYTAIQGARPVQDLDLLHKTTPLVEAVRPGRGRYYELHVASVTENWVPDEVSRVAMNAIQNRISSKLS